MCRLIKKFFKRAERFYSVIVAKKNFSACLKKIFETPHESANKKFSAIIMSTNESFYCILFLALGICVTGVLRMILSYSSTILSF